MPWEGDRLPPPWVGMGAGSGTVGSRWVGWSSAVAVRFLLSFRIHYKGRKSTKNILCLGVDNKINSVYIESTK